MGLEQVIYTVHQGCNSGLIKNAVELYFKGVNNFDGGLQK
jgi:hypothetical protein